jgi:hypothetical protein
LLLAALVKTLQSISKELSVIDAAPDDDLVGQAARFLMSRGTVLSDDEPGS